MERESDLLNALAANPQDDAARGAYVRLLERENRATQAEYLRLEMTMAGMVEEDPQYTTRQADLRRLRLDQDAMWLQWVARPYDLILERFQPDRRYGVQFSIQKETGLGEAEVSELLQHLPCVVLRSVCREKAEGVKEQMEMFIGRYRHPTQEGVAMIEKHPPVVLRIRQSQGNMRTIM